MAPLTSSTGRAPPYDGRRVVVLATIVAVVGCVASVAGFASAPERAAHAWLTAVAFAVSVSLGALCFLMIGHATGARWPVAVRRITETIAGAFVPLAAAFVPVLFAADWIYDWAAKRGAGGPEIESWHQQAWLNRPFFALRATFYFVVWAGVAFLLRRWSARDDKAGGASAQAKAKALSAGGLPVVGLTLTFASFDWLMSLDSAWVSSVFGVYWFAGGFVASLGLVAAVARSGGKRGGSLGFVTTSHYHALGRLLFGFSIFWAYIAFFQVMLIQMADKPDEVTFYLDRLENGWSAVAVLLIAGRFAVPFVILLPRHMKENHAVVGSVGAWVVVMQYVDVYWLVAPKALGHGPLPSWIDFAALCAVVAPAVAFAAWRLTGRPLVPVGDPFLQEALAYRSPS